MKPFPNGPRYRPADLRDPKTAHDALLHWDEQDEQILRLLAADPEHRGRLETLRRADGWLRQRAAETIARRNEDGGQAEPGPSPQAQAGEPEDGEGGGPSPDCPSAEELYDFGQGPGAHDLPPGRRAAIDRHLAACAACERLIGTLESPPPSPILRGEAAPVRRTLPRPRTPRAWRNLGLALATAAGLTLAFGVWRTWDAETRAAWPAEPLLRGGRNEALVHPRDRVLERGDALAALSPAWAAPLRFEIAPGEHAQGVRVELFRTGGGAFDRRTEVTSFEFGGASALAPEQLPAGHYTWKAWTRENGLEVELGSRDFEVVRDEALVAELAPLFESGTQRALVRAVRLLHERGLRTDARALARTLPASPERDAYLGQAPGR
jgi:hypothetical protein